MTIRTRTICLLLTFLLVGCSSAAPEGERSLVGNKGQQQDKKDGKKVGPENKRKKRIDKVADVTGALPGDGTIERKQGAAVGLAPREPEFATGSALVEEPEPDAQKTGVPPDYTEMMSVAVDGLGRNFRVTMSFAAELPLKMPEKAFMIVGFGLWRGDDRENGVSFTAQADEDGWTPYAGGKSEREKFPGKFEIVANQVVMTIPWSYIRGPYEFNWGATSGWFQQIAGGAATTTAFDPIPNEGEAHYPN